MGGMRRIVIGVEDLSATRFAVSPIGETVAALITLADPGRHGLQLGWVRWANQRLGERGLDLAPLHALLSGDASWPSFLAPPPDSRLPTARAELDLVRATPTRQLRDSLDRVFPDKARESIVDQLYLAPRKVLPGIVDLLDAAHELLIAPHWSRISALLDADIVHRSRVAAEFGLATMIAGLHERVSWRNGDLVIGQDRTNPVEPERVVIPGKGGLVVIPSVFVWPHVTTRMQTTTFTTVRYPARGIGALWEHPDLEQAMARGPALERLLGRPRARLLLLLRSPASPSDLATRLGVTPSAISQHLAVLHEAGLLARQRQGRGALYVLTELGSSLAEAADRPEQPGVGAAR
ncbi:MAG TPA: DUF5937 family protein [Pseudonocardiaceae bacterium]|jgi:DNA-binding transcriptional ArsR family regulator|nr:DUF5937 family protein [Pseudonocardiaceae bacterium]